MTGFIEWIKENAIMATLPVIALGAMIVDAEPLALIIGLATVFAASFIIVSIVRLIDIAIYNMR